LFAVLLTLSGQSGFSQTTAGAAAAAAIPEYLPKPPYKRLTEGPTTLNPGAAPLGFPFVDQYDSTIAAPEVHHVRYIDSHIRFVEVAYFPGVRGKMHGHAYASVFAIDDDPGAPLLTRNGPPKGATYPTCNTMAPQAPHAETNLDSWPHHFYRLEFRRVDGVEFDRRWQEWYPPETDLMLASSNTRRLLYEDNHVRLVEVSIRPGQTERFHEDRYSAVLAYDNTSSKAATRTRYADAKSARNGQARIEQDRTDGAAPPGLSFPTCATLGAQAAHAVTNTSATLIHYYRIEFKRIDGDALRDHWAEWYPWMDAMKRSYEANPNSLNY
jgi:hypothetical protein